MRTVSDALSGAMSSWYQAKLFLEHSVAFSNDALHVIFGVLAQFVAALLLRRPMSAAGPWLAALGVTLWNEAVDLWSERWPQPGMQYGESAKDLALTMLLPTLLLLAARLRPDLFRQASAKRARRR
jgi:hypothetical protein